MSKSFFDNLFISEEEYAERKAKRLAIRDTEKHKKQKQIIINEHGVTKFINYVDSLFISEEEYQLRKKQKKEKRDSEKAEFKIKAYETSEIEKFNENWIKTMSYMGLKNVMCQTFGLRNIKFEPYGFSCNIHAPTGMTLAELDNEKIINIIQDNLKCLLRIKKVPKSNHVKAQFITKDIPSVDFKPLNLSPYELYMSTGITGQPMTSNMIKYPHVLVQGSTGMGKTKFIDLMITNLITTESPDDVGLYIAQADKYEQIIYRKCEHCKGYADTLEGIYCMLKFLLEVVKNRENIIKPLHENGICENIVEYNKAIEKGVLKNNQKWNYLYLIIDEYATLMPDGEYCKETKQIKQAIQSMMESILQKARATGLFAILSTQRATIDKMPSFIKAMCNTIVTFRVNNRKSSEVAIDSGDAVSLKQREFISKVEEVEYGKTVNLTSNALFKWIKPFKVNKELSNFEEFNDIAELTAPKKGGKKDRASKKERRENKKNAMELNEKASDPSIIKNGEVKLKTKLDFLPKHEKETSNLDKPVNKPSEFFINNWVDPLSDPTINVIDKTTLPLNTEKPKKESDNNAK